jgi:hypothetical protein
MTFLGPAALRNRKKNAPRPAWKVADAFRQWLRGRPCACQGKNPDCGGPMRSAHVDYAGSKGMGTKVADSDCIPLSDNCHRLQHTIGWRSFEVKYLKGEGSGQAMSNEYWSAWPGRKAWEQQLEARNG